ncbi:MAG: hypothetical protein GY796_17920 [Chloroflexi bacterium]|nr:hypothetical protein [Chloroflexota bacterium]
MTKPPVLFDLQASIQEKTAFVQFEDYHTISHTFLDFLAATQPTRIISPNDHRYIFYQSKYL